MSHMFTYDWEENKNNWIFEEIDCVICKEKTKRILNAGKKKASKLTCGKQQCTNTLAKMRHSKKHKIKCAGCSNTFFAMKKNAKYCSNLCKKYRYKLSCVICKKTFNSAKSDTQTCSHECRWTLNRSKLITLICTECGVEFSRPTFTSRDGEVFCSPQCNNKYFVQINYGTFNRYGYEWYHIRKAVLSFYENTCQRCESKHDDLNVHHCVPFRYFKNPKQANVFDNLIPLCKKCHNEVHKENDEWYENTFSKVKI